MRAWARVWADLGNLPNPVTFTEFTEEGFGLTADPTSAIPIKGSVKAVRRLKGRDVIGRRTVKPRLGIGQLRRLRKLIHRGLDRDAGSVP